jgi:hypothetical protein
MTNNSETTGPDLEMASESQTLEYQDVGETPFIYKALNPTTREFRLLRLLPSRDFSSQIQCELFHSSLDDCPPYKALSYV